MDKKVVLVTGAASGLGLAISKYLAANNIHVFGADINNEALEAIEEENISTIGIDITNISSITEAFQIISKSVDRLDGLVNNAGIFDQVPLVEGNINRFEHLVNVNVLGAFRVTHVFFPLLHRASGRIINMSSETAKTLLPFQTYGISKTMMEAWSNTLRMELELLGMHVVLIRPGGHKTLLMDRTIEVLNDVPQDSLYKNALNKVKDTGIKKVRAVNKDPNEVAKAVFKALQDKRPQRIYRVNESTLYKILSILPRRIKESLVLSGLK